MYSKLIALIFLGSCYAEVTLKRNPLLSRKRRYLLFPEGSNFVMTLSAIKGVMVQAPKLVNVLLECDVPFKLPSDPEIFRRKNYGDMHRRHRREIYAQLAAALEEFGYNGNGCVKRMICDAKKFFPERGKSLAADVLSAIFTYSLDEYFGNEDEFYDYCRPSTYENCETPIMEFVIKNSMT